MSNMGSALISPYRAALGVHPVDDSDDSNPPAQRIYFERRIYSGARLIRAHVVPVGSIGKYVFLRNFSGLREAFFRLCGQVNHRTLHKCICLQRGIVYLLS